MERDELTRRLMAIFLGELEDHVQSLNRSLLALEKSPEDRGSAEPISTLFRTAHSLKGAARSVGAAPIESACHRLEAIFAAVRDGNLALDPQRCEVLFATADAIAEAGRRLASGEDLAGSAITALLPRLEALGEGRESATTPAPRPPPPVSVGPEPATGRDDRAGARAEQMIRLPAAKLDGLQTLSGELLVARRQVEARSDDVARLATMVKRWQAKRRVGRRDRPSRPGAARDRDDTETLRWLARQLDDLERRMASDHRIMELAAAPLEDEVLRARMVPFAAACEGLDRLVRDLSRAAAKETELAIAGGEVEIDRSVADGLRDPLLHLVRNAVDHGIELPEARLEAGKPRRGRITVSAALFGSRVEIVVADDGRGLDIEGLRRLARERTLAEPKDDRDLAEMAFQPGITTSRMITELSGRGIGLDVVKTSVEAMRGSVALAFEPGRGTRFTLAVPLTLSKIRALLVAAAGHTYALDNASVHALARVGSNDLRSIEGREVLPIGGAPVPLVPLADALGAAGGETLRRDGKLPVVVLGAGPDRAAFAVDELVSEQEIVVKGLGPRLSRVPKVTGATVLPTGRLALILNAAELVRAALGRPPARRISAALAAPLVEARKRLLLVEDSVTTRTLERSILEGAGYEVTAVADGMEAWQRLQESGADLVVSDIEMPRMDGFALTEAIRGSKRFRDLPVVLVTAMESEQDKARGVEVGADAYLLKSAFDQRNLLATIAQLL